MIGGTEMVCVCVHDNPCKESQRTTFVCNEGH